MASNALTYGIIIVVAVLVFVGAAIAVSSLASPVYDVSLSMSAAGPAAPYPYQSTTFNITVTNNGGREVVGLPVAFYVNGEQKNYSLYSIPAHQSIVIQQNYTYVGSGGYLFTAAADPGNVMKIANWTGARKSIAITSPLPQRSNVYESVPNSNISYTDSFTSSGTGLFSSSLMASLYSINALSGVTGAENVILPKTYQDLYPYIAVANGAYSVYANGTASYIAWIQGILTPREVAAIISSFNRKVSLSGSVEFSALSNTVSLCSYYQGGWTKIVEFYNASTASTCLGIAGTNYTPSESNVLVAALKGTKIGNFSAANQPASGNQISWTRFYYNNATVLAQSVEYNGNSVSASNLFQLHNVTALFFSSIKKTTTNLSSSNSICAGLVARINGTNVCSVILRTRTTIGNQSFGAIYSKSVSPDYTIGVYSLIRDIYLGIAHANAAELISRLGISGSLNWNSIFKNSCAFEGGFGCKFNGINTNGSVNLTVTNLNYSSVTLNNQTCEMAAGFKPESLNAITIGRSDSVTINEFCHSIPLPGFSPQTSFILQLGYNYKGSNAIVNGTLNVTPSS